MPALRASRGVVKCTGLPYIVYSPELGWCTPERILMNVDLPAPLSPSTHVTLPASTRVRDVFQRGDVAEVLADVAQLEQRVLAVTAIAVVSVASSCLLRLLAGEVVDEHCEQQHAAEEGEATVGVPAGALHAVGRRWP